MLYRCLFVIFGIAERQLPKSCEGNDLMNKRTLHRLLSAFAALVIGLSVLTGCGTKTAENVEKQEDAQTIQVYLWTNNLYETYAPYIQSQLPDVNIEFIAGNNDLDFYKFLQENGGLPDIITCCRFSLHDAAPLKDSLMNLALTNEAGAVYNTYLNSFKNEDGSVNWLPVCADAHGFVVNRSLFEQYGIPLPTDYESFVSACQAFEKVGIRGFTADYTYDYICMETLQGLSAAELTTTDGRKWRTAYSDPASTERVGLDDTVWPGAFERMAQFIQDTHLTADDLALNYDDVTGMFRNGEAAMYFGSSAGVKMFQDEGIDTIFLPFFSQNGEKWIMTTPYFQVALNRDLEQDTARREKAMKVLNVMLSEEAQSRIVADGQDLLSYSQNVPLRLTEYMKDVRDVVEENHMYIRIASNDFFAVSKDVVSKMIAGEYTAQQAYRAFNAQLLAEETPADDEIVLTSGKSYSNVFHANGGSASFSVMANTLFLCSRLKELREKNGCTMDDMAKKIDVLEGLKPGTGMNKSSISRVEGGKTTEKTLLEMARKYCKAFGMSESQTEQFLRGEKVAVPDTSALLKDSQLIDELNKEYSKVVIPKVVVDELDNIKNKNSGSLGRKAWEVIRGISYGSRLQQGFRRIHL